MAFVQHPFLGLRDSKNAESFFNQPHLRRLP